MLRNAGSPVRTEWASSPQGRHHGACPANRAQPWYQGPPWDVRMDNAEAEIGSRSPKDRGVPLHVATVSGVIERVDPLSRVVTLVSGS